MHQKDIDETNQLTAGGRVANKLGTKYPPVLLLLNVLSTYMRKHRDCSIMLEWNDRYHKPRLYTIKRTGGTALDKNVFDVLYDGEILLILIFRNPSN